MSITNKKCSVDNCPSKSVSRLGYCAKHNYRYKANGSPRTAREYVMGPKVCKLLDCSNSITKSTARGLCKKHYNRLMKYGDPYTLLMPIGMNRKKSTHYVRYRSMVKRCNVKTHKDYKNYGGRGISVTSLWLEKFNGFERFSAYISNLPNHGKEGYSLDRIDNDGDYTPGNLRWADSTTQQNNKQRKKRPRG
jgi:hypothetical protein